MKSDPIMEGGERGKEREMRGWEISSGGMMGRMRRKQRQGSKDLIRHVACIKFANRKQVEQKWGDTHVRHADTWKWQSEHRTFCTLARKHFHFSPDHHPPSQLPPHSCSLLHNPIGYICMNEDWDRCEIKHMTCDRPWDWCCGDAVCTCMCCFCSRYGKYIPLIWS